MKDSKGSMISGIVFGVVFIALGGFLFLLKSGSPIVTIIAVADLLFGVLLIVGAFVGKNKNEASDAEASFEDNLRQAEPTQSYPEDNDRFADDFDEDTMATTAQPEQPELTLEQLVAREFELRTAARRAANEAKLADQEARAAVAEAKRAEQEMMNAENEAHNLFGAEQQAAYSRVDRLGKEAMARSQEAAVAKKRAKAARQEAERLAREHSKAMDDAAAMMGDDDMM